MTILFLPSFLPDLLRPEIHSQFSRDSGRLYSWSFSIVGCAGQLHNERVVGLIRSLAIQIIPLAI